MLMMIIINMLLLMLWWCIAAVVHLISVLCRSCKYCWCMVM